MTTPDDPWAPPPAGPGPQPGPSPWPTGQYPPPGQGYGQPPAMASTSGYGQMAAGSVPPGMFHDQGSGLLLPDGTQLASAGRRIGAWFLSVVLVIVTLGIGYLVWGLIVWGRGQTPALQVLGMRVWRPDDRRPASWGYMALREIVGRLVEGILFVTYVISFIMMLSGQQRKTLHDLVAGTVVLYDPNKVLAR